MGIYYYKLIGSDGVEIFLILSAMGLCFSWNKNQDLFRFYKRRIKRIVPTYFLVGGLAWIIIDFLLLHRPNLILPDFFFITFFTKGTRLFWFVLFIIIMYFLFPMLHKWLSWNNKYRRYNFVLLLLVSILVNWILQHFYPILYMNVSVAVRRLTVFILGIYYGEKVYYDIDVSFIDVLVIIAGLILKISTLFFTLPHIPMYIVDAFFTIPLIFCLILLIQQIRQDKILNFFSYLGILSFELYLFNVALRQIFSLMGYKPSVLVNYILLSFLAIILSVITHDLIKWSLK